MSLPRFKALLIEDDEISQALVKKALTNLCDVEVVNTLEKARSRISEFEYDLYLVDVELPDGQGFRICSEIRREKGEVSAPIIFLTSKSDIDDKLFGFSVGCDDYIVKPFDLRELVARVSRHLKSYNSIQSKEHKFGSLVVDPITGEVFVVKDDGETASIDLTPTEGKILTCLIKNSQSFVSVKDLKSNVWGKGRHVEDNSLYSHVSRLKRKLEQEGASIESRNGGYCLKKVA